MLPGKVQTNSIFSPLSHFTLALKKSANTSVRMRVRVRVRVRVRGKRKSAITFVIALFFLVADTRISCISFRMDVKGGLTRKTKLLRNLFFYCLNLHSSYGLIQFHLIKKPEPNDSGFPCSGDTTRTCDLRVMSPTSYQLLHPTIYLNIECILIKI